MDTSSLVNIDEYRALLSLYDGAKAYLEEHPWCRDVLQGWHYPEFCIPEKLGVFLLEIEPEDETIGHHVWVINGDLPTVYLDDSIATAKDALEVYCELMEEWADHVTAGRSIEECYPVEAAPTLENAGLLQQRIAFIRKELVGEEV